MSERPRLGCAAVVRRDDRILLGVRDKEPHRGKWILPGGGVDSMETLEQTVKRELMEEAGLEVEVSEPIGVYELIEEPDQHRVIVFCWADHVSGEPTASDDLSEARFLTRTEVAEKVERGESTPLVTRVLRDIGWAGE